MPNQPTPTTTITPLAAGLLATAVLAATALAGVVIAQMITPIRVYLGAPVLLGVVATLGGGGFLTQLAVGKLMRRINQLDEMVSAQRVAYLPQQAKHDRDVRFLPAAQAAQSQGSVGLDPASIAAAKALARRIVDGPAEARRDAE